MSKPGKFQIYLNSAVTALYAVTAVAYFLASKPWYGALWVLSTAAWIFVVVMSVKTYRMNVRTYERNQETRRKLEELRRVRRSR